MKRTLIAQGKGGCTVYLPKRWIDQQGLRAGDEIDLALHERGLLVTTTAQSSIVSSLALTPTNRPLLFHLLSHLYRQGADRIDVTGCVAEDFLKIREVTDAFIGMSIAQQTTSACSLVCIAQADDDQYATMLRRLFFLIKESLVTLGAGDVATLTSLRQESDKVNFFCKRILNRSHFRKNLHTQWELLVFLMHIQHAIHYAGVSDVRLTTEDQQFLTQMFENYYLAYYKKDLRYVERIAAQKARYLQLPDGSCKEDVFVREIYRLIQIGTSPLMSELLTTLADT